MANTVFNSCIDVFRLKTARQLMYGVLDDTARVLDITVLLMPDEWRFTEKTLCWSRDFFDQAKDYFLV